MSSHNPSSLRGKVAIVTGGSRGIGAAIAVELAKRGANVTITYVSETSESLAAEVVQRIENMDNEARATAIRADVSSVEQCKKVVEATIALYGEHVDILVNNAGITSKLSVPDITPADFEQAINTNLRGPLFMAQAVIPHLRRPGRIINITSVAARGGYASASLYLASKAGLEGLTRALAAELGPAGHTVNAVEPGVTETDMARDSGASDAHGQYVKMIVSMTPLENRMGKPEDVASVVAMLAEPQASWVTGQTISASGGFTML
ncbi:Short chain dehydrogenase [Colletotrichum higginsianum IMI 349063]|uniref:Short chain dehydrogenase n=2 Tax=Colletotrichum higginsianum TaxID=80884 RepID=A0A1B7XUE4_COLHI|nr:Short chain dehydrogenase [Colletotrichum higginsianum IMI 349063]OBR03387.1 Short chain dehydrogenase [Colletotrichum higginsianum IMI 349063]TIC89875.1 3-oxoacyl-[acyl-carrier-protein] reductase FabG [Colletotrichum higginsianum]